VGVADAFHVQGVGGADFVDVVGAVLLDVQEPAVLDALVVDLRQEVVCSAALTAKSPKGVWNCEERLRLICPVVSMEMSRGPIM